MKQFIRYWLKPGFFILLLGVMLQLAAAGFTAQAAGPTPPDDPIAGDTAPLPSKYVLALDSDMKALYTVNTQNNHVYGPFLKGQLGVPQYGNNSLLDAVVTPDGKTALVSNFVDKVVYLVDVSRPTDVTYIASVPITFIPEGSTKEVSMFAEDITLTADGKYALVTDGGFASWVVAIDIAKQEITAASSFVFDYGTLGVNIAYFNALDSAPDGTIIGVDYFGASITTLLMQDNGSLTYSTSYKVFLDPSGNPHDEIGPETLPGRSVNAYVAPDGKTVLVPDITSLESRMNDVPDPEVGVSRHFPILVYTITAPGQLEFQNVITLTRAVQSMTFSEDGTKVYALGNNGVAIPGTDPTDDNWMSDYDYIELDSISILNISAPGVVTVEKENAALLYQISGSQLFGVDGIAYSNGRLYVGHPTMSTGFILPVNVIKVVNLSNFLTTWLPTGGGVIAGTRPIPLQRTFLPQFVQGNNEKWENPNPNPYPYP
ncbi:MAG TPA: hypothetical protein PKW33_17060 [Anaerolineaceae bacterium]|nr:hypothetical protein [Anaerolineaceae bacterium]HPN53309.1 hypothetical protein [Anaerolineaceae bacterium]